MSRRLNEIQTRVDTVVYDLHAVDAIFLLQIRIKPRFNVLYDGLPA